MAPTEIEALVTFPIESALNGAAGVRRVRSATAVGVAVVWVEFDWGEDIYRARQIVDREAERSSAGALPPRGRAARPRAGVVDHGRDPVRRALESDRHSPIELRTVADTMVRRRLLAVPGRLAGDRHRRRAEAVPGRRRIRRGCGTTTSRSTTGRGRRWRQPIGTRSAGFRVAGGQEYLIRGVGRVTHVDDIGADGRGGRGRASRPGPRSRDGPRSARRSSAAKARTTASPAVILGIQKQPGANTLELTRTLDAALDDIQSDAAGGDDDRQNASSGRPTSSRWPSDNLVAALRDGGAAGHRRRGAVPGERPRGVITLLGDSAVARRRRVSG